MATLLNPFIRAVDANGDPVSGGQLALFDAGTTTPVTTYSDRALSTAQAQPLIANAAGEFEQSFVEPGVYKIRASDADGVTLYENDNVRIADRPDDPVTLDDEQAVSDDTTSYADGTIVFALAEATYFEAAPSGATTFDLTNAGGQKLRYKNRNYLTYDEFEAAAERARGEGEVWMAGGFRYKEASSGASDHHVTNAAGVKFYWMEQQSYSLEYFGLINEISPTSNQAARVQDVFDFLTGQSATIIGTAQVGVSEKITLPSETHISAYGLTLFGLSSWGATDWGVSATSATNGSLRGVTFDGNLSAWSGMYPQVPFEGPKGFAILAGCENFYYIDCRAQNMNGNGFTALAGGGNATCKNVGFERCIADTCGVPFGQEIHTVAASAAAANLGPQDVQYINCRAEGGNFGLYLAGGSCVVNGGYFDAKRNQALTMYCGDAAYATCPTQYTIVNAEFHHTGVESNNQTVFSHTIAAASALATYGEQPEANYTAIGCVFSHAATGSVWIAEEGSNLKTVNCKISGGNQSFQHRATTLGPAGTYREGVAKHTAPLFTGWGGSGSLEYAVSGSRPIEIDGGHWTDPNTTTGECVAVGTGTDIVLRGPTFGRVGASQQPRFGIFAIPGQTATRVLMYDAVGAGITGLTSASASLIPIYKFFNSTPANAFDRRGWSQSAVIPTVGTWARGDIVWKTTPSVSSGKINIGWICVSAGAPGTWEPMFVTNS